jgi:DNA polymerase-3 subunit alpha
MAFITLEDLVGSVEVIVFPKTYEGNAGRLNQDAKVFIQGRVSAEEDKEAKLIASKITLFDELPRTVWIQFADMGDYEGKKAALDDIIDARKKVPGARDSIAIYLKDTKQIKKLPSSSNIRADEETIENLNGIFGEANVKIV